MIVTKNTIIGELNQRATIKSRMGRFDTMMEQIKAMFPGSELGGNQGFTETTLKAATIMLTIGPIVLIYPFCQKYYVKGISAGAVKG